MNFFTICNLYQLKLVHIVNPEILQNEVFLHKSVVFRQLLKFYAKNPHQNIAHRILNIDTKPVILLFHGS